MKITFIMPCVGKKPGEPYVKTWLMEPLAIAVLSSLTPQEVERTFYDDRLEDIPFDDPTDLVAITVETYTAHRAYQIAAEYRKRGIKVVMGGFHATLMSKEVREQADAVVSGTAEGVWASVLDDFTSGNLKKHYQSAAVSFADVPPDRSIYRGKPYTKVNLIETARGCIFGCEFCSIASFFKRAYVPRPIDDVIAEIRSLPKRVIFFIDDNIAVDVNRTKSLLRAVIPLKVKWIGQISLNNVEDSELLSLMKKSGCLGVLIGMESLDQQNLKAMGKKSNMKFDQLKDAHRALSRAGLAVYATFMFGYDGDSMASFPKTYRFMQKHRYFFAAYNHVVPFPGTPLYDRLEREGRLLTDKWYLSASCRFGDVVFKPKLLSPHELSRMCFKYRRKFYSIPSIINRALHVRANTRNLLMASIFFIQNVIGGRDVHRRQGLPFGVENHETNTGR